MEDAMTQDESSPRPEFANKDVPLMLFGYPQSEYTYRNYPAYQRHYVWPMVYRQKLIDSILRGLPIPPLLALRRLDTGGERYEIIDGKQRMETIFAFMLGTLQTPRELEAPYRPMYPGLRYTQLPPNAKRLIDNYSLRFEILVNANQYDTSSLSLMFRRLQISQKLTSAEIVWGMDGVIHDAATQIEQSSWWEDRVSAISKRRRAIHYFSLALILLEIHDGFAEVGKREIERMKVTPPATFDMARTVRAIQSRLTHIDNATQSYKITSIPDLVIAMQAARFLEDSGIVWGSIPGDALTQWLYETREAYSAARPYTLRLRHSPWGELLRKSQQFEFWSHYRNSLVSAMQAHLKDPQRAFNTNQKIALWATQKGKCSSCGRPVSLEDVGHHRVLHSNGGLTTVTNGALVHVTCHAALHAAARQTEPPKPNA